MKKLSAFSVFFLMIACAPIIAQTNDFYDDAPTKILEGDKTISINGEISHDVTVDLTRLSLRSIIVKETILNEGIVTFAGAYRYDGYSLYDILDSVILKKKNEDEFPPIIDLYVEISNEAGESVVLSWGEIYYPSARHQIIIATAVARIVPSKTGELWPLPEETKLVVGPDLITSRNISNPSMITIRSLDSHYPVTRGMSPMYCRRMRLCVNGGQVNEISKLHGRQDRYTYNTVFYGRGMGIHGITPFRGTLLSQVLNGSYLLTPGNIRRGIVVIAGIDGYRAAFTLSEIVNRNDQNEILLIDRDNYEGAGRFSLFPACDFFSDRAIKSVMEINLIVP
jgi:hypothetical protein